MVASVANWLLDATGGYAQRIDKRTSEVRTFDIDFSRWLAADETIQSVLSVGSEQGEMTFGVGAANATTFVYPNGRLARAGKVVQVQISAGTIPAARPSLLCYVRALVTTNQNALLEATVPLRLIDNPTV